MRWSSLRLTPSWLLCLQGGKLSGSSAVTILDGRVAQGYSEFPQVKNVILVHLSPQNTAPGRNRQSLPSRACKFTSSLKVRAYNAIGQTASALYAKAILQVYQAKALKDLHEGSPDPEMMQELHLATDYVIQATKVTAFLHNF